MRSGAGGDEISTETRNNRYVAKVPIGYIHQPPIEQAVLATLNALGPDVVRIRYSFGTDWSGEPSIFFRIVLSDAASRPARLKEVSQRVALRLMNEVMSDEFGVHAYFNFRSESEQAALKEPDWN